MYFKIILYMLQMLINPFYIYPILIYFLIVKKINYENIIFFIIRYYFWGNKGVFFVVFVFLTKDLCNYGIRATMKRLSSSGAPGLKVWQQVTQEKAVLHFALDESGLKLSHVQAFSSAAWLDGSSCVWKQIVLIGSLWFPPVFEIPLSSRVQP